MLSNELVKKTYSSLDEVVEGLNSATAHHQRKIDALKQTTFSLLRKDYKGAEDTLNKAGFPCMARAIEIYKENA